MGRGTCGHIYNLLPSSLCSQLFTFPSHAEEQKQSSNGLFLGSIIGDKEEQGTFFKKF